MAVRIINPSDLAHSTALGKPIGMWQNYRDRLNALARLWQVDFWQPTLNAFVITFLIVLLILVAAGGAAFWTTQFYGLFFSQHSGKEELALARSGISNVKKMIGDDQVWALAIQPECRFGNQVETDSTTAQTAPVSGNIPRYANYTVDYSSPPPISQSTVMPNKQ